MASLGLGVVAGVFGVVIVGPWLNHAILRWVGRQVALPLLLGYVPSRSEIGSARAGCRACGTRLSGWGLPGVRIGGRCRRCGEPVRGWVVAVEVATGIVFGVTAWRLGWSAALVPMLLLVAGLVAMSAVDFAFWRIPTRFVYATTAAVIVALLVVSVVGGEPGALAGAGVGAVTYFSLLAFLYLLSPRMLGLGDVRLAVPMGLAVGWMTWTADLPVADPLSGVLRAALLGSLAGTVVGVALLVVRRRSLPYPFGPWLSLGTLVTILAAAPGPI